VVTRFVWPLQLPLSVKCGAAVLLLVASQYHLWSRLSSGSVFSPEFPRPVVVVFDWAFGAIIFLAMLQLLFDGATLLGMLIHGGGLSVPDRVRYAMGAVAAVLAALGVHYRPTARYDSLADTSFTALNDCTRRISKRSLERTLFRDVRGLGRQAIEPIGPHGEGRSRGRSTVI
jgi:hypothetical protein